MSINIIIMGVAGAGKSTVARSLSAETGWPFIEGDDHHPTENISKQASGISLENADRAAWISALADAVNRAGGAAPTIIACSALNTFVRSHLEAGCQSPCVYVWLDVSRDVLQKRLNTRSGHFMPPSLLGAQLATLDPPGDALHICGEQTVESICADILAKLNHVRSDADDT